MDYANFDVFYYPSSNPVPNEDSRVDYLNDILDKKNAEIRRLEHELREAKFQFHTLQTSYDSLYYKHEQVKSDLNKIKTLFARIA